MINKKKKINNLFILLLNLNKIEKIENNLNHNNKLDFFKNSILKVYIYTFLMKIDNIIRLNIQNTVKTKSIKVCIYNFLMAIDIIISLNIHS